MELLDYFDPRWFWTMFQHALNDTAAIRMRGQMLHLATKGIYDEGNMISGDPLDCFLNDMIPVLIFDTFEDAIFQFLDKYSLLVGQDMFKRLFRVSIDTQSQSFNKTLPSAQLCSHTSVVTNQQYDPSSFRLVASSESDFHARRTFVSRSSQIHP